MELASIVTTRPVIEGDPVGCVDMGACVGTTDGFDVGAEVMKTASALKVHPSMKTLSKAAMAVSISSVFVESIVNDTSA